MAFFPSQTILELLKTNISTHFLRQPLVQRHIFNTNIHFFAAPKKKDENPPTPPVKRGPGRPPGSNNKNPSVKNGSTTTPNNNNGSSNEPPEKRSKVDPGSKQDAVTPLTSLQVNILLIFG